MARATLRKLQQQAKAIADNKGWGTPELEDATLLVRENRPYAATHVATAATLCAHLCLIHSEVSEACEDVRNGRYHSVYSNVFRKPAGMASELADVMIRVLDLAERCGFDMQDEIERKMAYNATREYKHGGKLL